MDNLERKFYNLYLRIYNLQNEISSSGHKISPYRYGEMRMALAKTYIGLGEYSNADRILNQYLDSLLGSGAEKLSLDTNIKALGFYAFNLLNEEHGAEAGRYLDLMEKGINARKGHSDNFGFERDMEYIYAVQSIEVFGAFDKAEAHLDRAEELFKKNTREIMIDCFDARLVYTRGLCASYRNDFTAAVSLFKKAAGISFANNQSFVYLSSLRGLAEAYANNKDIKLSVETYRKYALERDEIYLAKSEAYADSLSTMYAMSDDEKLISKLKDENSSLAEKANIEALTGLFSKHFMRTYINDLFKDSKPVAKLSAIMLDIDYFKRYNDNYGHILGDGVLHRIGEIINEFKTETIHPIRYGGEEFLVLLEHDEKFAEKLANDILRMIRDAGMEHQYSLVSGYVTISAGVSSRICCSVDDVWKMIEESDIALYESKDLGRDRCTVFSELKGGL